MELHLSAMFHSDYTHTAAQVGLKGVARVEGHWERLGKGARV